MPKKILVVDDEKPISDIIKFNLTKEGFDVDTAYDGEEAVKSHARSHRKGLVCGKSHNEHTDCRGNAGRHEHRVPQGSAACKIGQQIGVKGDDVSHRHKSGQSGDYLGADGSAVFL